MPASGLRVQAPFGGLLGAREIVGVEQGLGQIQVAGAELRIPVHRRTKMRDGLGGAAVARQQLRQVEMRLIELGAHRDLGLVGGHRVPPLAARLVEQPEIVVGHRLIRLEFDRVEQGGLRRIELLQFEPRLPELDEKRRTIAFELQALFERRGGARKVAAPHRQAGELIQRSRVAGIQLPHPLEAGPRLVQLSGVLIGQRQAPRRAFVLRVDRQRLLVRSDRLGQPVCLDVHVAEHRVCFDDLGVGREDLAGLSRSRRRVGRRPSLARRA